MRLKTLALSVLVLAVLAGIAYYVRRPAAPATSDARVGQPLVARATVEQAAQLRLSDQGKTVQLVRQADGSWRVASYHDLPADFAKLSSFVGGLTEAQVQSVVTSSPARIARLEFKDTAIALLDAGGKELWSVTLGKSPETGGGRFIKFGAETKAYRASFSAWLDSESKNWANPELLDLKPDTVAKVEIPFADGGPVTVSRAKKDEPWAADKAPAGRKLLPDKITSLLSSLGNLRFFDTSDPTEANVVAAKANLRTFRLTTFDGQKVTVALGRKPEEKKLKAPAPKPEEKTVAPAAEAPKTEAAAKEAAKPAETKPATPEYETIPAGPVYVFVSHSDAAAPVNALMAKRAFQINDYTFTGLPQKADDLFETPPPPPAPKPEEKPAAPESKSEDPKKP